LKKNLITIKEFITQSIGEWKSIRSTHTLAFQEFENTNSRIKISYSDNNDENVQDVLKKFDHKFSIKTDFSINISWVSRSDWQNNNDEQYQTLLIFAPHNNQSGIILRDKGYTESIHALSEFHIDNYNHLNIITKYSETLSEEKIWFLSDNVRSRYSVIKNKIHNSILQTSHSTEIRKVLN
tara:strand:+ start:1633 stop:2175 length:543 start_codon:yes stop_codon:yes gene_type:complete